MNLDLLQTFLTLAETRSFRQTAEQLYISQSAVTVRIKNLESELEQPLFLRNNKTCELSPAGVIYLKYAKQMYQLIRDSRATMLNFNKYKQHISFATTAIVWENKRFMDRISAYAKKSSDVYLRMNRYHSDEMVKSLTEGELDICITHYKPHNPDIESIKYITDDLVLVGNPQVADIIEGKKGDNCVTYSNIPLIYMEYGPSVKGEAATTLPFLSSSIETNYIPALILMLDNGLGVGFVVKYMIEDELKYGKLKCIDCDYNSKPTQYTSYILFNKKKKEQLKDFIDTLTMEEV